MARFLAVSTWAIGITLCSAAPAAAYHVDTSTQTVVIDSLRDFDKCQKDHDKSGSEACLDALKAYIKTHPKDAFDAGKRARLHYMHWVALDFFDQALRDAPAKKRCADEDVSAAVISGLALPPHYPAVALAKKLVSESCRKELEASVAARLEGAGGYFRSNACPLVADKVSKAQCEPVAEEPSAAALPTPAPERSAADELAAAPRLREAPPLRTETPEPTPVHRLREVFRPIPVGKAAATTPANILAELKGLDWKLLNLDSENVAVLHGAHGEELTIERTKPGAQPYVLLKFKGVRSPWNERVLVAIERDNRTGKDYVVAADDRESVVMIERQGQYQAFPKGVTGGIWLNAARPNERHLELPNRRNGAREIATVAKPSK